MNATHSYLDTRLVCFPSLRSMLDGDTQEGLWNMTRLPYQTTGGTISESDTFTQLLEYLRLAEEAAYLIGHMRKANDDELIGQGFLAVGEMLKMTQANVTKFIAKTWQ